jgi:hypothetical protein
MVIVAVITAMAMIIAMAIMLVILQIWLFRGRMRRLTHNPIIKERAILAGPCFDRATESSLLNAMMERFNCAYTVIIAYSKSFRWWPGTGLNRRRQPFQSQA